MAPSIKRGKIRAQVYGDVSGVVVSLATKTCQTFGFIRNTNTTTGGVPGAHDAHDGDGDGGGLSPPSNGNNRG